MDSGIYIKDQHDGEEILRAIQISTFRLEFDAALTFSPMIDAGEEQYFLAAWNDWLDGKWNPYLCKHLVQVYMMSREFKVDEIVRLDEELNDFLDTDEAARSLAGGLELVEGSGKARHQKVLEKFCVLTAEKGRSGHAATIFAIQAAAFHLPLFSTLVSYLYYEWKCGARQLTDRSFDACEQRFAVDAMGALGGIRELLRKYLGGFEPAACA